MGFIPQNDLKKRKNAITQFTHFPRNVIRQPARTVAHLKRKVYRQIYLFYFSIILLYYYIYIYNIMPMLPNKSRFILIFEE